MATGGVFQIITNDGKQDRMLMATDLLKARLNNIMQLRAQRGMDPTPTLVDIEKTHILFMNAHFKPFAAIGYEYNKVRASAGTVTLNSEIQFSIPQFGDFFHDMVLHVRLGAVSGTGQCRWCSFPGERLLNKVKFSVNGNALDEYYNHDYTFYRQFELPECKKAGYYRCVGQQMPIPAQIIPNTGSAPNAAGTTSMGFGTVTLGAADTAGAWINVTDGYQTNKSRTAHALNATGTNMTTGYQRTDILEVTMPLLFWFNRDPRLSIASVSIPFGQRFVEVTLCALSDLIRGQEIGSGNTTTNSGTAASVSISGTEVVVCDLYVNNIFVNPEVHDIFIKRIGFNLIRVHRRHISRLTSLTNGDHLLSSFKWPIESIYFGFRDAGSANNQTTSANANFYLDGWHRFAQAHEVVNGMTFGTLTSTPAGFHFQYEKLIPVVQNVTFKAHGINIYNDIPAILYNQYLPYHFGSKINTPDDPGVYMVTFNLYPGMYQPSGHINISRAREFYIGFDDTVPTTGRNLGKTITTADLIASANAINFLLISDGSAVIRYST